MKPLFVLVLVFAISLFLVKMIKGNYEFALPARIAMAVMLLFTSIAHFVFTKGMTMMVPGAIPYKTEIVYITGFIEILAAVGLLIPRLQGATAWLLLLFFMLLLPANIYAAVKHINYEKATYDGSGLSYLWFRVPLQVLFMAWVYFSAIKLKIAG